MRNVQGTDLLVIDAHVHVSAAHAARAVAAMARNGVDAMIDVTPNTLRDLERKLVAFSSHPGRLFACWGVDPSGFDAPDWIGRECRAMEAAAAMGAAGVKFAKEWGLVHRDGFGNLIAVDHERLGPLFETAGRCGLPVVFHSADPRAFFDPPVPSNERYEELRVNPGWSFSDRARFPLGWWQLVRRIERVVARHPGTTFVGAHFGCAAEEPDYVADMLRDHPRYHVDTAARIGELGRRRSTREALLGSGNRVLFGTDLGIRERIMLGAPQAFEPTEADVDRFYEAHWRWFETTERGIDHPTPIQGRWTVDGVGLPVEALGAIYGGNASRVFASIRRGSRGGRTTWEAP